MASAGQRLEPLTPERRRKVLGENARKLYNLDL